MTRFFEDVEPGETVGCGRYEVTREEIVGFAERYDPQPVHLDPGAAADTAYGGLIASGWHTAAMCMRRIVEGFLSGAATVGSPGVEELRWPAPVRPGDTLAVELTVGEKRPSEGDPERGVVHAEVTASNDEGETVCSMRPVILFARRQS